MRIVSHTCSNTEIVSALGCADFLVGVDADSDYPPEVVQRLPQLGRDLSLDIAATQALKPDLVLSSRTLPGHDQIVLALEAAGLRTLVCEPLRLADVYADITRIAEALDVPARGTALVSAMQTAMPPQAPAPQNRVLVEWWPKPVIAPTRDSWVTDLITLAGGMNPFAERAGKSTPLTDEEVFAAAPDHIVMSWCGVKAENYRADIVRRRAGWADRLEAVRENRIHAISEAFLGRPGPRLVEGYRALRQLLAHSA